MIVFITFILLVFLMLVNSKYRGQIEFKSREDWTLDLVGLLMQGILIPILQITVVYQVLLYLIPHQKGCLHLSGIVAFAVNFVLIDYLYYWNHRCLHQSVFWKLHQVHHTVTEMDVFGTSRNTIWTSFLIIYLWINALGIYLLQDATGYLMGMSLTSALDLWRHSPFQLSTKSWLHILLSSWFILPQDHHKHHQAQGNYNYGANLKIWDRLHGTYQDSSFEDKFSNLGLKLNLSLCQKLIYPIAIDAKQQLKVDSW